MVSWIPWVPILLDSWNENWQMVGTDSFVIPNPLYVQLEVLDTAGAEQFTSLNEVYIKVAISFNIIHWSSDDSCQSGRGFVLVFRSKILPTWCLFVWNVLQTAWRRKQAYKKWTTCGIRLLGSKGPMRCVLGNNSTQYFCLHLPRESQSSLWEQS